MIKFNGINHLAMVTGDMDKTVRFWRDLLGMRLVAGLGKPGYRHYFFEISEDDLLAFFEWPGVEPVEEKDHAQATGPLWRSPRHRRSGRYILAREGSWSRRRRTSGKCQSTYQQAADRGQQAAPALSPQWVEREIKE